MVLQATGFKCSIICSSCNGKTCEHVLKPQDCIDDDDDVRDNDIFLDETDEIDTESETPDCSSAEENFQMFHEEQSKI